MTRVFLCRALLALTISVTPSLSRGQKPAQTPAPQRDPAAEEQAELNQAVGEAGNSAVDLIRALEKHLAKYPNSKQRIGIEQAIAKAAIEANDGPRIIQYGQKVLATPTADIQLLERVARELVAKGDSDSAKKAIAYLKRYQSGLYSMRSQKPPQHFTPGQWQEQLDRSLAQSLAVEAHALGNSGQMEAAADLARHSWDTYPTAEGARQLATWLARTGHETDALEWLANAFTLEDPGNTEADRARDRSRMGDLYTKAHGSEKGLGDLVLLSYDRMSALVKERVEKLKLTDPNARAADIFDFTLQPVGAGTPLALSSLRGKTVIMDFWATWCMPCRAQHPLLENVKKRFAANKDVVFLSIDSDDEPALAAPFIKEQGWEGPAWFEGGLERRLTISSIPTLLVIDRNGRVSSRMAGLIPERFEAMLTDRINEALGVDRLAWPYQSVPPANAVRVARQGMAHQDRVALRLIQRAPGLVRHRHRRQMPTRLALQRPNLGIATAVRLRRGPRVLLKKL